jgi:Putative prokaryotic signal transducing protein
MPFMIELMRTNDAVLISYVEALLRDSQIAHFVADQNMSILDGSIGILPRRVMVDADEEERARRLMRDAGLGDNLK